MPRPAHLVALASGRSTRDYCHEVTTAPVHGRASWESASPQHLTEPRGFDQIRLQRSSGPGCRSWLSFIITILMSDLSGPLSLTLLHTPLPIVLDAGQDERRDLVYALQEKICHFHSLNIAVVVHSNVVSYTCHCTQTRGVHPADHKLATVPSRAHDVVY